MNKEFDVLIDSFIMNKVGISNEMLSLNLCNELKKNLLTFNSIEKLKPSNIGNASIEHNNKKIRRDKILWLDRKNENIFEDEFLNVIDAFVLYLNSTCYTGITGYEFHYAMYEVGSFYTKHFDQFKDNSSRQYSMIFYLNENWVIEDGGELKVYLTDKNENISPNNRKTVFFKSNELEHEVLITNKLRLSITGWLKV